MVSLRWFRICGNCVGIIRVQGVKKDLMNHRVPEGHGDLVSRLMRGILWVIVRLIGVIDQLTKSP